MVAAHHIQATSIQADVVGEHRAVEHHRAAVEAEGSTDAGFAIVAAKLHHPHLHVALEEPEGATIPEIDIVIAKQAVVVNIAVGHHHMRVLGIDSASMFPGAIVAQGGVADFHIVAIVDFHCSAIHIGGVRRLGVLKNAIVETHLSCFLEMEAVPTSFTSIIDMKACRVGHGKTYAVARSAMSLE